MRPVRSPLRRVTAFLFFSGACALIYQVAWFRELRLVFGGSTAASSAVLAVFMGGLGAGGLVLGRRADQAKNAFGLYANLELIVAATAGLSPLLVRLAQAIYFASGGSTVLGSAGATILRLVLTVFVLGPSTFAMGGTLPAAARAVEEASDVGRRRVAVLYGANTFGAVVGALSATFILIEVFGTRTTLWLACLVNALVAMIARTVARDMSARRVAEPTPDSSIDAPVIARWFPPAAAAIAGFAFMLMELVWYRMLAPLLGGSSYTFGLILAVALAGIGIGGALYSLASRRATTLSLFALTCALEAVAIAVPYALGNRIAFFALLISPLAGASFSGAVLAWSLTTTVVILPAAIISGFQFPAIIALYGHGSKDVGRDVGRAYLANTLGSIGGSIAGGFGLMPLLTAPHCWQLVVGLLVATVALSIGLERKPTGVPAAFVGALGLILAIGARGPTHAWRHSAIGAGRANKNLDKKGMAQFEAKWAADVQWEADGLESSVALDNSRGYSFLVNGKSDGNINFDRATQVMSGILTALLHDHPKSALVIGLGTGSTAGWLGAVPEIERVDVMELEPAILRVAKDCGPANKNVLDNPKVHVRLGDAREGLLTSRSSYDIVFSEPSNPYRAGISSLYTEEYYRAIAARLTPDGVFAQWIQTYEVDPFVLGTAITTLRAVFPDVTVWRAEEGDALFVARLRPHPIDVARLRERVKEPAYAEALAIGWGTSSAEGILAHFVAAAPLAQAVVDNHLGVVNHDDDNALEFAFARHVGTTERIGGEIEDLSLRLRTTDPPVTGPFDREAWAEERLLEQAYEASPINSRLANPPPQIIRLTQALSRLTSLDYPAGLEQWRSLGRKPRSPFERVLVATGLAVTADPGFDELAAEIDSLTTRQLLRGVWLHKKQKDAEALPALVEGFVAARKEPWFLEPVMIEALEAALAIGTSGAAQARQLVPALAEPFAVERARLLRVHAYLVLATRSADPASCVAAFERVGSFHLERDLLEARVACYASAHDPRLDAVTRDLANFLELSPTFGNGLHAPQPEK